jgi:HAD superfamily hydrolase (TIGR01490 family)
MSVSENRKIAAFFDFDNTVITVDTATRYFKAQWKNKTLPFFYALQIYIAGFFYNCGLYPESMMIDIILKYYVGKDMRELSKDAATFYSKEIKFNFSPNILKKISWHREQSHILVLCSGGFEYILKHPYKELSFDHLICSKLNVDANGILPGTLRGPICLGSAKKAWVQAFSQKKDIDLNKSYFYSDHHRDLPLLEAIGNPIVVAPTSKLSKIAIQNGWPIINHKVASNNKDEVTRKSNHS